LRRGLGHINWILPLICWDSIYLGYACNDLLNPSCDIISFRWFPTKIINFGETLQFKFITDTPHYRVLVSHQSHSTSYFIRSWFLSRKQSHLARTPPVPPSDQPNQPDPQPTNYQHVYPLIHTLKFYLDWILFSYPFSAS